ncbi:amidohydrolase family protein [Leifsonia sp. WHRI 6310E]|uniref:amidohydrolase family protein n=1 Tax=Leifsonia sp. WHRI 6310E TaxID=3162562 RepID=UPI0032EBF047
MSPDADAAGAVSSDADAPTDAAADAPVTIAFDAVWTGDGFRGPTTYRLHGDHLAPIDQTSNPPIPGSTHGLHHLGGTLFPRLTDHHVHLGLVDPAALFRNGITHAADLGWSPEIASTWLHDDPRWPSVTIAGAFLTARGGYPTRSGWAPSAAAREVGGPREARRAVREQVMAGASRIKVALNSEAGETVDNATLAAIVEEAVTAGLPVVAHAQGTGQTARAIHAGVAQLAHTPFSERLSDRVIADAAGRGMSWISTLDIHGWGAATIESSIAVDNLRRFAAAGGRVLYGTDLGNGPLPLGVNARELTALLSAGLDGTALLRSIAGERGDGHLSPEAPIGPRITWIPGAPPVDPAQLPAWLATARGLHVADLPGPGPDPGPSPRTHPHAHAPSPHPSPTPSSPPTSSTEGPLP